MQQHENNETTCVKPKPVATQCLYVKQLLHDELLALYHHATAAGSQRPPELCGVWRMIAAVMGFWRYSITPYNWLYYCLMAQQGSKPKAASRLQTHCTQHNWLVNRACCSDHCSMVVNCPFVWGHCCHTT
jgi:hypothetical protein